MLHLVINEQKEGEQIIINNEKNENVSVVLHSELHSTQ